MPINACRRYARKLFAGEIAEAGAVLNRSFRYADGVRGWGDENQFGCYQILGDLTLAFEAGPGFRITSPSGHAEGDGKTIAGCVDGNPGTKWCVHNAKPAVQWQMELPEVKTVESYTLTSADDVPARDPQVWVLEGSADGKAWTELDRRSFDKPFEKRFQTKRFEIARPGGFRFYRFTFTPHDAYFQVAEIALAGVPMDQTGPVPADYRRELNLMTGVATTRYTQDGVIITRELVASKPDEVIAAARQGEQAGRAGLHRRAVAAAGRRHPCRRATAGPGRAVAVQQARRWRRGHALPGAARRDCQGRQGLRHGPGTVDRRRGRSRPDRVGRHRLFEKDFAAVARQRLDAALGKPFDTLVRDAVADHRSYMERCQLTLPAGPNAAAHARARETKRADARPVPGGPLFPVRPAPRGVRFAARLAVADESAGHLGRGICHALARRLPQQHQSADELLAGGGRQPVRLPPAAAAVHAGRGPGRPEDGQGVLQRAGLDGQPHAEPLVRHRAELPAGLHRADLRRLAGAAHLAALCVHAGQGVSAGEYYPILRGASEFCRPCWSRTRNTTGW